jgi:transposase
VGDHIEVPLAIDDLDVVATEVVNGALEVRVRSTFPAACRHCGSRSVIGHGRNERRLRDRSCGQPTVLVWHQRRLLCRDCGRTGRELHPAVDGRRAITVRFRRELFDEACERPFSEVAAHHRVSAYRVVEAFDAYSQAETKTVGRPRVLAMDESSFKKRFVFQTVLFDPIAGRGLAVADGRDRRAAEEVLFGLPRRVRRNVETVVIDCHIPFQKAINTAMPQARIVVDKFHVLAAIDRAANNVRVRLGHKKNYRGRDGGTARQHNPRNDPQVYRARWAFAKRRSTLAGDERDQLFNLFADQPEIGVAWWLKEAFAAIYEAPDRADAERRLELWEHHVATAGIKEIADCWRNLQRWREEILAYLDDPQTNGYAEGVTNKIKVMKRRAYGYRNRDRYRRKILTTSRRTAAG